MEWYEYVKYILVQETLIDNITIKIAGENAPTTKIPPIVKASIFILDDIIANQGIHNIFVLPEKSQLSFAFTIFKALHNIASGKTGKTYDPYKFVKGQKLKYKNCVMEFNRIEIEDGEERLYVSFTENTLGIPIEMAPFLQLTDSKRLSKYSSYVQTCKLNKIKLVSGKPEFNITQMLLDYKTHLNNSIFYVSSVMNTTDYINGCCINGEKILNLLFIGQANSEGNISTYGSGQLSGVPSIVLAPNLYAVMNALDNGAPIQSLIVDVSNPNVIDSQLDVFDELSRRGIPILCICDTANSFDLQCLTERSYNLWRWDNKYLTNDLKDETNTIINSKIKNSIKQNIDYEVLDGNEISDSIKILYGYRNKVGSQSPQMISMFDKLFTMTFTALRNIIPLAPSDIEKYRSVINECNNILLFEKKFISPEEFKDYIQVTENFFTIYNSEYDFPKAKAVMNHLCSNNFKSVCLVIPDRMDKAFYLSYWTNYGIKNNLMTTFTVVYPAEYTNFTNVNIETTIVVGWLNNNTMRRILYSYNSSKYFVLLYDYELRWQKPHVSKWKEVLDNSCNKRIIEKSLSNSTLNITTTIFSENNFKVERDVETDNEVEELEELELVLRENKYRQYIANGGQKLSDETVEAYPVNYVGNAIAFYKKSHSVITVTEIIINDSDKIKVKFPEELSVGDFVIIREADRDLIREIADLILNKSGKNHSRRLARKWKDALNIENVFSSQDNIFIRLKDAGCSKDFPTVRRWINDDDVISPHQKEDLICIAKVTEDAVLMELVDEIFDAGRDVKSAHIQAGKYLSEQLKRHVAEKLKSYGEVDPFNIWEPLSLCIDDLGTIKILKIIDIGTPIIVDINNTNHLIEEN